MYYHHKFLCLLVVVSLVKQVNGKTGKWIFDANLKSEVSQPKRIIHFTDIHYYSRVPQADDDTFYGCKPDNCRNLVISALNASHDLLPQPEYIVLTGDLVSQQPMEDLVYRGRMQSVADLFKQAFGSNTAIIPVLGIHDSQPAKYFPDEYCMTYKAVYAVWKDYIGDGDNERTFLAGGYYKVNVSDKVTVVALNTNLYATDNTVTNSFINQTDPAEQFQFLEDVLENAVQNGRYIHIAAHHPLGSSEFSKTNELLLPEYNKRLHEIIVKYANVIKLIVFGHEQSDSFRIFKNPESNQAVQVGFVGPSMTADDGTTSNRVRNPAFRIYDFDSSFVELEEISTYYTDAHADPTVNWQLEYEMKKAYNLESLKASSFLTLLNKMRTDDRLYNLYRQYSTANYNGADPTSNQDRGTVLCAAECTDYNDFQACLRRIGQSGRVLQFTDFHYDKNYSIHGVPTSDKLCHYDPSVNETNPLGIYGDYKCDANEALISNMLNEARKIIPNPDYILWTGDNYPHINNYTLDDVLDSFKFVTNLVDSAFPSTLVLPVFGNHDYSPANAFPDKEDEFYINVYELWKNWITEDNKETFTKGGYYKYNINNVTVLVLNTNLYYRFNTAYEDFQNKTDPAGQFQFMIDNLEDAKLNNRIVHVVSHMAPGVFERTPSFTWMYPEYNQRFIDITVQYASTIKWMVFGHHHTDTFHIVKNPNNAQPVQVYFMAPAVTPWFSTLPGAGSNNPSFRILDYDITSQELLDIKTYYVDLNELNANNKTWELEYSMRNAYNISDKYLNAATMNKVLEAIKSDKEMFKKYIQYNSVLHDNTLPVDEYLFAQLCSLEFPDYDGYNKCMSQQPPKSTTPTATEASTEPNVKTVSTASESTAPTATEASTEPNDKTVSTASVPTTSMAPSQVNANKLLISILMVLPAAVWFLDVKRRPRKF